MVVRKPHVTISNIWFLTERVISYVCWPVKDVLLRSDKVPEWLLALLMRLG
jgi:hypothetical protein